MQATLEATLSKLIAIPSTSHNREACLEVMDFIRDEIEPYGLFIRKDFDAANPWLLATTQDTNEPDILLAAHVDVVPAAPEMFIMQKRDGNLYGRGVYDMKFAAACYLEFLKLHTDILHTLNIGILFTTDEEGGSACMSSVLETGLNPKVVFLPDGGDNWAIEKRAKAFRGVELIAHGKTAHGSRPWEGKNAIHTLLDALQELRDQYPKENPNEATLIVSKLTAGEAVNQVADYASALLDFRSFEKKDLDEYETLLNRIVSDYRLEMNSINKGLPILFNEQAPAVQGFIHLLKEHLQVKDVPFCDSYGGSDARFFTPQGVPCIIIEPTGGGRHSAEEWLKAEDLSIYYRLVERWILSESV